LSTPLHHGTPTRDTEAIELIESALAGLNRIILGKDRQLRLSLACLLARGHLLIEDIPGVGKTTLAHALARTLGLVYQRIQFTSDLLPADIIGVSVFEPEGGQSSGDEQERAVDEKTAPDVAVDAMAELVGKHQREVLSVVELEHGDFSTVEFTLVKRPRRPVEHVECRDVVIVRRGESVAFLRQRLHGSPQ